VAISKEEKPSSLEKGKVHHASDDAAVKEAEKILRKYSATMGKFAE
jgi:hypothetical protein